MGAAATSVAGAELPATGDNRPAAVLCLLFEEAGEAQVLLTRRARDLRAHAGEVSFPGGRLRPGEAPLAGALREAEEEVGLAPASVQVIGELTPLTTRRSPALVSCFVGRFGGPGHAGLVPNHEVDKLFWAPLATLVGDGVFHEEMWPSPGAPDGYQAVPFFELEEDTVWGATGRLLVELLSVVLGVGSRGPVQEGTLEGS